MISVITVSYNSEKTIEKTIQSMLEQTFKDFEYILIDGASTDNTLTIAKRYQDKFNGKMRIVSEPDHGIYDAMNKGIKASKGSIIGILNSDDWYEKNTLESVSKHYTGAKYEIVYGMQRTVKDGKEFSVLIKNPEFLDEEMITHPTFFVTRDTYKDFGLFSTEYKSSADYEFMLRLKHSGNVVFTPVYEIYTNFTLGGMSSSNKAATETARIKYRFGLISKKRYQLIALKNKVKDFLSGH